MNWVGRFKGLGILLIASCVFCTAHFAAAQTTQPAYSVRFYRPTSVGQSCHLDLTMVRYATWKYRDGNGQTRSHGERIYGCKIIGRVTAKAVGGTSQSGTYVTRTSVDVESLTSYDGASDHQLLPAGSVVTAELRGRQTIFTVGGKRPAPAVQEALRMLLRLDPDPAHARYHDQAFGIDRPVQIGDSWAIDPTVVAGRMQRAGTPIPASEIHGNVSFDNVQMVDGQPWLTLQLSLHSDSFKLPGRQQSSGADPTTRPPTTSRLAAPSESASAPTQETLTSRSTYKLPQDPNLQAMQFDNTNEVQFTSQMRWEGRLFDLIQLDRTATSETITP